jgi:hypothetical protein
MRSIDGLLFSAVMAGVCLAGVCAVAVWGVLRAAGICA